MFTRNVTANKCRKNFIIVVSVAGEEEFGFVLLLCHWLVAMVSRGYELCVRALMLEQAC